MKVKLFLCNLLVISVSVAVAQLDPKADSLKLVVDKTSNDSIKLRTLLRLAFYLDTNDINQSQSYWDKAMELATKNDWPWAKGLAYSIKGSTQHQRGDYVNSLESHNKELQFELLIHDSLTLTTSYINVGNSYLELGKLEEAYYYTKKSLEIASKIKDTLSMAIGTHNMAKIYSKLKRIDLALANFNVSGKLSEAANDLEGPAYNNHELGNAYILTREYEKAKEHLTIGLSQSQKLGIAILTPQIFMSLGEVNFLLKNFGQSMANYDSSLRYFKKIENQFGRARAQVGKSNVLNQQKQYKQANEMALSSLKMAQRLKAQILILQCYNTLSEIAEMNGNIKDALNYQKLAQLTRDSLTSINVMSQVFENEFQMRALQKDDEIAALTKMQLESSADVKRQQFLRNIFAVVFALTLFLLYSVYRSGKSKVEMHGLLLKHQAELEKRSKELEELNKVKDKFFSIISHDLRSPINSMAGLLDLMERNEIKAEELPMLTKEMRIQFNLTKNLIDNLLDWTLVQMNKVSIKIEKIGVRALVDENIKLLSSMSLKKTNFINEVDASYIALADLNMLSLVVRNLILNGIKFTDHGGTIKISAVRDEKVITMSIADNGVGISKDVQSVLFLKTSGYSTRGTANEKGTGLGLILAKEFIERNGGTIRLESEVKKGTTLFITIPVAV